MKGRAKMRNKDLPAFFNRLEYKIAAVLFFIVFTALSVYGLIVYNSVSKNLNIVEKHGIDEQINTVSNVFLSEAEALSKIAKDYSVWDEAYEHVSKQDTDWVKENVIDWIPENFGVDLTLVTGRQNNILGAYGLDSKSEQELLNNSFITQMLQEPYGKNKKYPHDFIEINGTLYIFSAYPIITYHTDVPPAGITLIGQKIDADFITNINKETGHEVFIDFRNNVIESPVNEAYINENYLKYKEKSESGNAKILGKGIIVTSKDIYDYKGNVLGQIYLLNNREIFKTAMKSIDQSSFAAVFISLAIVMILLIPFKRIILNPVRNLHNRIIDSGYMEESQNSFANLSTIFNEITASLDIFKRENSKLKMNSRLDPLTTLYNERYFHEYFSKQILNSAESVNVIFCDIDNFSLFRQVNGYDTADFILYQVGRVVKSILAGKGMAFRLKEDSFVILLEGISKGEALDIAEDIRAKVYNKNFIDKKLYRVPVSMSFGIVSFPEDALDLSLTLDKAEKALYYAKNNGGNRCQAYTNSIDSDHNHNKESYERKKMQINSVYAIVAAVDAKDNYTSDHSQSVARYALKLADKLGMSERDKDDLRIGALLHDCGKIGIPDYIVKKPGKLSETEWNTIKNHSELGHDIIKYIIDNPHILSCVRNHHERWDGKGYPDGLSKLNIPYYARIVCIADSYHAMISDRPYRTGLSKGIAIAELRKNSGIQFDPALVEKFIEVIGGD